ncbi:Imm32 family immunity protein [Gilvimarinus sp. F26214L]|uniref:Imm32 family immunity protein n=1 Tax=Gilvimarinus sp. DZF01 TaxID=3461371 RepID=UPI004045B90F
MKIYGYPKNVNDLQELVEVTFQAEPDELRQLAKFLAKMAQSLEDDRGGFGHGHAKDYCEDWEDENPEIIVFKPNS